MEQTKIIKFENGETIVAVVEGSEDYRSLNLLKILYPIEIVSEQTLNGETVLERFSLKPWITLSDETLFEISTRNISTIVDLKETYIGGYERMVNHFYFPESEEVTNQEEEEVEVLLEYWNAKSNNEIN